MLQPPQSLDAPDITGIDGGVDSLANEVTSDVEHAEAQAGDKDSHQRQAKPPDQRSGEHDGDYHAPVVVAPLPGASAEPPRNSTPVPQAQSAETPRPHRTALSLAAMASVAVAGLNPTRLALPQSETLEQHIIGVIDTQGHHWEIRGARTDTVGASLETEAEVLRRIERVVNNGQLSFDVPCIIGSLRQKDAHIQVRSHVEGKPVPVETLRPGPGVSAGLGKTLGEIHELSMTVTSEASMPVCNAEEVRRRWLSLLDDTAVTGKAPPALLGHWEQALGDTAPWCFRPTVVRDDLAEKDVLMADGTMVVVRGWSQTHMGDPAKDLAQVCSSAPVDYLDSIEDAYDIARSKDVDRYLREQAELVSELGLARQLLYGVRTGDKPVINDTMAMLKGLAAQIGDAPLVEPATPRLAPVPEAYEPTEPDTVTNPVAMVRVDDKES